MSGLKGLNNHLGGIKSYLEQVTEGKLPINHQIIYQVGFTETLVEGAPQTSLPAGVRLNLLLLTFHFCCLVLLSMW